MIQLYHQIIHYYFEIVYYKMCVSEKIKTIDNKIKQNNAPYILVRKTANISALSSGNANKYEFLTGKDIIPEKHLLEKAATVKRFQYSSLDKELKSQTDITKKEYQKLGDAYEFDKIIKKENYSKSNLIYDANHSLYRI